MTDWRSGRPFAERILVTGAAGQIGKALRQGPRGSCPLIHLLDVALPGNRNRLPPLNIEGCYNLFEAARRNGASRSKVGSAFSSLYAEIGCLHVLVVCQLGAGTMHDNFSALQHIGSLY